jgi:hypothetical protein
VKALWIVVAPTAQDLVEVTTHVTAWHAWKLAKVEGAAFNECAYRLTTHETALRDLHDMLEETRAELTPWLVNEDIGV